VRGGEAAAAQARHVPGSAEAHRHQRVGVRGLWRLFAKSNCLSVVPVETEFGRKRAIDQSSCNKDYSCVKGFCPSFVTVEGGTLRKKKSVVSQVLAALPEPTLPGLERPYGILVTGVGGTGVVTIGALLGMAAHLEARAPRCST
jgi:indolepyruvate ferredoxin oxidoreductase